MTSQTPEVSTTEIEEVVEDFVKGMWYVTGESQYPEGDEKKAYHQGFSDAVAMAYIGLTGTPKTKGLIDKLILSQQQKHQQHEQDMYESLDANYKLMLQTARKRWLREEIVKLEETKPTPPNLLIPEESPIQHALREGEYHAVQIIIDRYNEELNQDNV